MSDDCKSKLNISPNNTIIFVKKESPHIMHCFLVSELNTMYSPFIGKKPLESIPNLNIDSTILKKLSILPLLVKGFNTYVVKKGRAFPINRKLLLERGKIKILAGYNRLLYPESYIDMNTPVNELKACLDYAAATFERQRSLLEQLIRVHGRKSHEELVRDGIITQYNMRRNIINSLITSNDEDIDMGRFIREISRIPINNEGLLANELKEIHDQYQIEEMLDRASLGREEPARRGIIVLPSNALTRTELELQKAEERMRSMAVQDEHLPSDVERRMRDISVSSSAAGGADVEDMERRMAGVLIKQKNRSRGSRSREKPHPYERRHAVQPKNLHEEDEEEEEDEEPDYRDREETLREDPERFRTVSSFSQSERTVDTRDNIRNNIIAKINRLERRVNATEDSETLETLSIEAESIRQSLTSENIRKSEDIKILEKRIKKIIKRIDEKNNEE